MGTCDFRGFQSEDDEALVKAQIAYVRKIVEESNAYDNAIYEIIDEPTLYNAPSKKVYKWVERMMDNIIDVEECLPKKHLIAQQLMSGVDFSDDDRMGLIVTQYIGMAARQIGGIQALDNHYFANKPIEVNETAYVPSWYDREHEAIARLESWEFMVGGGAAFNQLNGYFVVPNPSGDHPDNHRILQGFMNLRTFMESMDYAAMKRSNWIVRAVSIGAYTQAIADKGRCYALYMHHSLLNRGSYAGMYYEPNYGDYAPVLTMRLEEGTYDVEYIDPANLNVLKRETVVSDGSDIDIACPRYTLDIAIRITGR